MLVGSTGSAVRLVGGVAPATVIKSKLLPQLAHMYVCNMVAYLVPSSFRLMKTSCWTLCTHSLPPVSQLLPVCG